MGSAVAPWGATTSEVIQRPTLEAARHMAAVIAAEHSRKCLIEIRSHDGQTAGPVVEKLRGECVCDECDQGEPDVLFRMMARRADRGVLRNRIEWAGGHGLIGDDECDALHILTGDGEPPPWSRPTTQSDAGPGP